MFSRFESVQKAAKCFIAAFGNENWRDGGSDGGEQKLSSVEWCVSLG
jgi:hypothetical protein